MVFLLRVLHFGTQFPAIVHPTASIGAFFLALFSSRTAPPGQASAQLLPALSHKAWKCFMANDFSCTPSGGSPEGRGRRRKSLPSGSPTASFAQEPIATPMPRQRIDSPLNASKQTAGVSEDRGLTLTTRFSLFEALAALNAHGGARFDAWSYAAGTNQCPRRTTKPAHGCPSLPSPLNANVWALIVREDAGRTTTSHGLDARPQKNLQKSHPTAPPGLTLVYTNLDQRAKMERPADATL
jgi:hypothetical protein